MDFGICGGGLSFSFYLVGGGFSICGGGVGLCFLPLTNFRISGGV